MRVIAILLVSLFLIIASTGFAGEITGKVTAKGARNAAGTLIYIDKIEGKTFEAPKEHVVVDQKNLTFVPHVLPVLVGTTVDFLNSDEVLHNVFVPDKCADKFNLGTWPQGQTKSYTFKKPCVATLLCNVHPEMEAYVVAVETPYFAVADKDGGYTIKDVPPGKYTLQIWHKKLKGKPVEVTVPTEGSITQDFQIRR
ncbi:MAG: plastocyanin/azurin family copper-binding protein [bacterium]